MKQKEFCELKQTAEKALQELDEYRKAMKRSLERIAGMCGNPDASEGCRNILKEVRRVLTK